MKTYLAGLPCDEFGGLTGIFVTAHHISGFRYFSAYDNGNKQKRKIFDKLASGGMKEIAGQWDWHHVVEGNHLAPLFAGAEHSRLYRFEWPTVLMHSAEEHKILNSLFRSKGTLDGLRTETDVPLSGSERAAYIQTLRQRYQDIYSGDPVLQKVARNVISKLF